MSTPEGPPIWAEFPPYALRDYALLADGHRGALVGPRGDVVWLCAPRWDSDAVLSSLIGGEGGYAVTPVEPCVWGGYHEPGTLIWRSRWVTPSTEIECREALAYPGDPDTVVLLRRVDAVADRADVRVVLDLRAEFGQEPWRDLHREDDGTWTATVGKHRVRWSGAPDAVVDVDGRLRAHLSVAPGEHHDLVLEVGRLDAAHATPPDPQQLWDRTERTWHDRVPDAFGHTAAPRDARHSYAVLCGMTHPAGGMVAAATLGLPEKADEGNSYDYRFVWLRDQAYVAMGASAVGQTDLLDSAVRFATERVLEGGPLRPAYRVDGTGLPHEHRLDLSGYPGGRDVVGNWVRGQTQLDVFGELMLMYERAAALDHLDRDGWRAVEALVRHVESAWNEPDAGIWELDNRWWTHSRLACVAGLRAVAPHAPRSQAARWEELASLILHHTTQRCLAPDGSWQRAADVGGPDASLLLPPVRGALPADDPRTRSTLEVVRRDLVEDGYLYRFADGDDLQLGVTQGAFTMCGFMMALALHHQGDDVEAVRWFERNRATCGPPGLYAEEYDVQQRQLRGNLPQAFVHAMLLETAGVLSH
ncbi:glycoside hydrolase family 15 protein [Phycicoccus ginsengisoli]